MTTPRLDIPSDEFEAQHPEIAWQRIVAQRHVLAHEYGEILHDRLWGDATEHIPAPIESIERILPEEDHP